MKRPAGEVLGKREFHDDDQRRFATLSGDYNEIHLDPVAARRAMGGERVVHGINTVLWAVDRFLTQSTETVTGLECTFRKPIHLEEEVEAGLIGAEPDGAKVSVTRNGTRLVDIRLDLGSIAEPESPDDRTALDLPLEPAELSIEEMSGLVGRLAIPVGDDLALEAFPQATSKLGGVVVSQLASISRLVGMVCPGRYSLLSGLDLVFNPRGSASHIDWKVTRADTRVAAVSMELTGGRVEGTVKAFVRPRPTSQPTMRQVAEVIAPDEFSGSRVLVVGGSRGLGELTAKLLAAGGADVVLTWLASEQDADLVVDEIKSAGASASSVRLDVADPAPPIERLASDGWLPDQVYYFATPPIFVRRTAFFDQGLFDRFADCYVGGFARVVEACRNAGAPLLTAFYPSSVAVDEAVEGLTEYAAAKSAGEVAARILGSSERWLTTVIRRLPRLPTDQTATFIPVPTEDPMTVMTALVREMTALKEIGEHSP